MGHHFSKYTTTGNDTTTIIRINPTAKTTPITPGNNLYRRSEPPQKTVTATATSSIVVNRHSSSTSGRSNIVPIPVTRSLSVGRPSINLQIQESPQSIHQQVHAQLSASNSSSLSSTNNQSGGGGGTSHRQIIIKIQLAKMENDSNEHGPRLESSPSASDANSNPVEGTQIVNVTLNGTAGSSTLTPTLSPVLSLQMSDDIETVEYCEVLEDDGIETNVLMENHICPSKRSGIAPSNIAEENSMNNNSSNSSTCCSRQKSSKRRCCKCTCRDAFRRICNKSTKSKERIENNNSSNNKNSNYSQFETILMPEQEATNRNNRRSVGLTPSNASQLSIWTGAIPQAPSIDIRANPTNKMPFSSPVLVVCPTTMVRLGDIDDAIRFMASELAVNTVNDIGPRNGPTMDCTINTSIMPANFIGGGPIVHSQVDFVHCLVPDLERITNSSFYWGKMDRYEAERLLEGKAEGTFLLRDSAQEEFLFSVTFRKYGRSLHARIEQSGHKFSFDCHDPCVFTAPTVTGLLEHYKDPACVMFFEPMLTIPLHREKAFSLQQLCRATIVSNTTYDGINELELPTRLKSYLKEYHYKQKLRVKPFDEPLYTRT